MTERLRSAVLSLVIPGAGQFAQKRPAAGIAFLTATLIALLALGLGESWHLPGGLPLLGLVLAVVCAPADAWRHAVESSK